MKLTLNETEIKAALTQYVLGTVSLANVDRNTLEIDFTNTRGTDGLTATIDIPYAGVRSLDLSPKGDKTVKAEASPAAAAQEASQAAQEAPAGDAAVETAVDASAGEEAAPVKPAGNLFGKG